MVKTGSSSLWQRMPVHLYTTFRKFSNYAVYSDSEDTIGGIRVIDALANTTEELRKHSPQFRKYREHEVMQRHHVFVNPSTPSDFGFESDDGGWTLDKFKNLPMLLHAYENHRNYDWYVMIDDDTYLFADSLVDFLSTLDPDSPIYTGSAVAGMHHIFAHGGSGIVLSRGLMDRAFGDKQSPNWVQKFTSLTEQECCGDYMIAKYLHDTIGHSIDFRVSSGKFNGETIYNLAIKPSSWCAEVISLHHVSPREFELLSRYEEAFPQLNRKSPYITNADIYQDFMLPYFRTDKKSAQYNWDNGAKDVEYCYTCDAATHYYLNDEVLEFNSSKPYASIAECNRECQSNPECLMFRYDPYKLYCGIGTSIALGQPRTLHNDHQTDRVRKQLGMPVGRTEDHPMASNWQLDRVRELRQHHPCDVTNKPEGWWVSRHDGPIDPLKNLA
ncbi:hypothetical protein TRVA0_001S07932 [Trichomonascus vanleenenianus]|uniref:uncharacterized protein n=1 Tax=Trichomonascus vanleenenianus TaxID=2268995 RepID=UPI003EC9E435